MTMVERHGLLVPAGLNEAGDEPTLDGYTDKVRHLEALAAEAERIRALPTVLVLERRQQYAEDAALAELDAADHARKLSARGRRERAELVARAASAAARRQLDADVDIRALALSRRRRRWSSIAWTVLILAMSYTCVNVQRFAAGDAAAWSPGWLVAWGVDPLLSLLVVGLLLARGDLVVLGVAFGEGRGRRTVRAVEVGALLACLLMNVAPTLDGRSAWQVVVLHVVVPLGGMAAALVLPIMQEHYSTAITQLYRTPPDTSGHRPDSDRTRPDGSPDTVSGLGKLTDDDLALLEEARAAIAAGTLPADASGRAIHRVVMRGQGDKTKAYRIRDALTATA